MNVRDKLNHAKRILDVSTDQELADILKTNKRNLENWIRRDVLPDKWNMIISHHVNPLAKLDLGEIDEIKLTFYPDVYASAGYGATNDNLESQTLTVSKFFLNTLRISNIKNLDVIHIYGDSMEPDFKNGEYVVVERVDSLDDVNNGNTVIANINGDTYIKKLEKVPFKKEIILHSSNKAYDPIKVEPHNMAELNIVGVVRGLILPR